MKDFIRKLIEEMPEAEKPKALRTKANAESRLADDPTDQDAIALYNAAEARLLDFAPKGAMQNIAKEAIEEVAARHDLLDIPGNKLAPGVKAGGEMRCGWVFSCFYVGYKPEGIKRSAVLAAVIIERGGPVEYWVYPLNYDRGPDGWNAPHPDWDLGVPIIQTHDAEAAVAIFKEEIGRTV